MAPRKTCTTQRYKSERELRRNCIWARVKAGRYKESIPCIPEPSQWWGKKKPMRLLGEYPIGHGNLGHLQCGFLWKPFCCHGCHPCPFLILLGTLVCSASPPGHSEQLLCCNSSSSELAPSSTVLVLLLTE